MSACFHYADRRWLNFSHLRKSCKYVVMLYISGTYIYIYIYIHTHTYIYIYKYIVVFGGVMVTVLAIGPKFC
jgi:hypothetical protein